MGSLKTFLVAVTVLILSACNGAETKVVYDCTMLNTKDKESLSMMIARCDSVTSKSNCKENARKAMCKPTMYLIPNEYNGDTIRSADTVNLQKNNS